MYSLKDQRPAILWANYIKDLFWNFKVFEAVTSKELTSRASDDRNFASSGRNFGFKIKKKKFQFK